jgi:hypothetical protein
VGGNRGAVLRYAADAVPDQEKVRGSIPWGSAGQARVLRPVKCPPEPPGGQRRSRTGSMGARTALIWASSAMPGSSQWTDQECAAGTGGCLLLDPRTCSRSGSTHSGFSGMG